MNKEIEWEKEFDAGHNAQNISDPSNDTVWVKSFIRSLLARQKNALKATEAPKNKSN